MKNNKYKTGFTLFELLVSVSIIGILIAMVSVSFSAAQRKARDAKRMQDMSAIQKAAEQYYALNSSNYPVTGEAWTGILEMWPIDPKGAAWTQYSYTPTGTTTYCACAKLEESGKGNSNNNICTFGSGVGFDYYCVKAQQ